MHCPWHAPRRNSLRAARSSPALKPAAQPLRLECALATLPGPSGSSTARDAIRWLREVLMLTLDINGKQLQVDVEPDTPLLWVLRDQLQLTGSKFGCGKALCGACTVHLNGTATRSCVLPVSAAVD